MMGSQFLQVKQVRLSGICALALVLGAIPAKAQTYLENIGVPPFTTNLPVENGFINAANGNLHLEIPLGSFPQRAGAPDKIVLMYDSAIWSNSGGISWDPHNIIGSGAFTGGFPGGSWRIVTSRDAGMISANETDSGHCGTGYSTATYSPWIWVAPDGTQHSFPAQTVAPINPTQCNFTGTPSSGAYASDGSGFYISITNYTNATVFAPDGTKISPGCDNNLSTSCPPPPTYATEDPNGNYALPISRTFSNNVATWTYTDTLGRTVLTEQGTSGSNVYTLQLPNAQGGTSTYTVTTELISVSTNFGQPGVAEYASQPGLPDVTVIQSIQLPDGTSYSFNYDSGTTPGHYGVLTSMTLPTGGMISYSYGVFQDATTNKYLWINSRTTPDGAWTYTPNVVSTCAPGYVDCQQTLTVNKPLLPGATTADQIVYTFTVNGGAWPAQVQYKDHVTGVLATTNQCFNFVALNADGTCSYSPPVAQSPATKVHLLAATTTVPITSGNVTATTLYSWDLNNYGELTQIQEWNFGNAPPNAADRTTQIGYYTPGNNILNRPSGVTVKDKTGATAAQTLYGYDVYTYNGGNLASVTATGHDPNYDTNITVRGNVTSIQNLVSGSTYLNSYNNYDTTGQITNAYDTANQKTSYAYVCQNAYPTTITNALSQATQIGYDCNTGSVTSIQDPNNVANNQSTSFSYDNMFRPLSIGDPDGGQTSLSYNYNGSTLTGSTTTQKVTSTQNLVRTDSTDGLGRVTSSVTTSDPDGSTTVTTSFDTNGRVSSVSNPYRNNTPNGYETYVYDALDRVTQTTHVDGHVSSVYYGPSVGSQGGAATQQLCIPASFGSGYPVLKIDEANNKLQSWIDGFGRTIEADEPTVTSGNLTANTCYGYDANNNLTGVLSATTAAGNETRTFVYDGLSRLTKAINPETGGTATPTFYNYDADGNCATPNSFPGDLASQVDPRGIRTCMQYDALHRLTAKIYSDGTPTAHFLYDQTSNWGLTLTNPIGRLTQEYTDTTKPWSASILGYDPMGRVVLNNQCTPANCGTSNNSVNYTYDLLGDMATYTNGAGVTFTQSPFNGAGRLTKITSSLSDSNTPPYHPGTLLSNVHYNALGETTAATLGNGAVESLSYAPRGWPLSVNVASQSTGTPGMGTVTINGSEESQTGAPQNTSQGPNGAGTAVDQGGGYAVWGSLGNITAPDGQYVGAVMKDSNGDGTDNLQITNFGFSLPSTTISINGIQVDVLKKSSVGNTTDYNANLVKAGSVVGTNYASSAFWPTSEAYTSYGGSTDLWGVSWTYSDINSPNFGFNTSAQETGGSVTAGIDFVRITVWYTVPGGPTYDTGTVSVTVNGTSTTPPASYGNGSTGASIATQLTNSINAFGFVTASNNGTNVITITSTTNGLNTNYTLSASSQSSAGFNPVSFTTALSNVAPCGSASCMKGGTGAPGTLYSFNLGYTAGNSDVTTVTDSVNGTWAFTYDYLNRLSIANQNNGVNICSFGYDQLGNRTSQTATAGSCGGNLSLSYAGNNNRMDGYSYDLAGNLVNDGTYSYTYDAENRITSVKQGGTQIASYVYDAEGRRVQKTAGTQVEYLYDLDGNIVTELSSTGVWNRGEIFANGQHLATYNNGTTYFDHADWLGTERARSNMADANCETITSLPYGDSQSVSGTSSGNCVDANPLHFTGQQWDAESGLHYFGARHYSSQFGRFMSPDPTGIFLGNLHDPQSLNLYSYVRNNSLSLTDPSGLGCRGLKNITYPSDIWNCRVYT